MTDSSIPIDSTLSTTNSSNQQKSRGWLYIAPWFLLNTAIWTLALLYLKIAPARYTSEFALIIPGVNPGISIKLPDLGQADDEGSNSPYEYLLDIDPRKNYEPILISDAVIEKAAESLNMSVEDFGDPEIELEQDTTIIQIEIEGETALQAQEKAQAIYEAFANRLKELRSNEVNIQNQQTQESIEVAQAKLNQTQKALSRFKSQSILNFPEQIENLSINIEQLRRQQAEAITQQQAVMSRLTELSANLNLPSSLAADALALYDDQLFQSYLQDYNEVSTNLASLQSKFTPNNPQVQAEKAKQVSLQHALFERSRVVLNKSINRQNLERLYLNSNGQNQGRSDLFQELINLQAEQQGLVSQVQGLTQQIAQLESRLKLLAQEQFTLDQLERDVEIAETLFTSTVAQVDLVQPNISTSYPPIQLLSEPTVPDEPASPNPEVVLLGASAASFLVTTGIVLLWWERRKPGSENFEFDSE